MANEQSKVAGVAEAVKAAKRPPKKQPAKKSVAEKPHKTPTPRKKKEATESAPLELSVDGLNSKELKVFTALNGPGAGVRTIMSITELAEGCFKSKGRKQSNSWARNSLRRLVQAGLVEKVDRGQYRVSESGRKKISRAA